MQTEEEFSIQKVMRQHIETIKINHCGYVTFFKNFSELELIISDVGILMFHYLALNNFCIHFL